MLHLRKKRMVNQSSTPGQNHWTYHLRKNGEADRPQPLLECDDPRNVATGLLHFRSAAGEQNARDAAADSASRLCFAASSCACVYTAILWLNHFSPLLGCDDVCVSRARAMMGEGGGGVERREGEDTKLLVFLSGRARRAFQIRVPA